MRDYLAKLRVVFLSALLLLAGGSAVRAQSQIDVGDAICIASVITGSLTPKQLVCFLKLLSSLKQPAPVNATQPGLTTIHAPESIAEVGEMILKCYHPTGQFEQVQVIDYPWRAQHQQWAADHSVLLLIRWRGSLVGNQYAMAVGLVERSGHIRTVVQQEQAPFPASTRCALNNWVQVAGQ